MGNGRRVSANCKGCKGSLLNPQLSYTETLRSWNNGSMGDVVALWHSRGSL
jgi:hypothetical protein